MPYSAWLPPARVAAKTLVGARDVGEIAHDVAAVSEKHALGLDPMYHAQTRAAMARTV